MPKWS